MSVLFYAKKRVTEQMKTRNFLLPILLLNIIFLIGARDNLEQIINSTDKISFMDVVYIYDIAVAANFWFLPLVFVIASICSIQMFCSVWKNGYWKSIYSRTGKDVLIIGEILDSYVLSFATILFSQLLFILELTSICWVYHYPLLSPSNFDLCDPNYVNPLIYLFLRVIIYALSAAFWTMVGILVSSIKPDLFTSTAIPLSAFISIDYILARSPLRVLLSALTNLQLDRPFWVEILIAIIVFGSLGFLFGMLSAHRMKLHIEGIV